MSKVNELHAADDGTDQNARRFVVESQVTL